MLAVTAVCAETDDEALHYMREGREYFDTVLMDGPRNAQRIVLLGPSVGAPPDPLFARGITHLGGSWVMDARGYCDAVLRGEIHHLLARSHLAGNPWCL